MLFNKNPFEDADPADIIANMKNMSASVRKAKFDEFDVLVGPWEQGYLFDENTSKDDLEYLSFFCQDKRFVVLGCCSNIYGEFPKYENWYRNDMSEIVSVNFDKEIKGLFWPNTATQKGYLPKMYLFGIYKKR